VLSAGGLRIGAKLLTDIVLIRTTDVRNKIATRAPLLLQNQERSEQ
jgi:hypothetical protein